MTDQPHPDPVRTMVPQTERGALAACAYWLGGIAGLLKGDLTGDHCFSFPTHATHGLCAVVRIGDVEVFRSQARRSFTELYFSLLDDFDFVRSTLARTSEDA